MTILFAFISDRQAAIAADGNIVCNDNILPDNQDKTFLIHDKNVVGAFANNMSIDNRDYGNGVSISFVLESLAVKINHSESFIDFCKQLIESYLNIINSNDTTAPSIDQRTSNILLAGSRNFNNQEFEIYFFTIDFNKCHNKLVLTNVDGPKSGAGQWYVNSPVEENSEIHDAIQSYFNALPHGLLIEEIAKKGIQIGIETSKISKCNGKLLGGHIFYKKTDLP